MFTQRFFVITTTIYIFCISLFASTVMQETVDSSYYQNEDDPERNERSTPRSFILPATPAVALEQEQRKNFPMVKKSYESCISRLTYLGYDIDDADSTFNTKLIQAIIEFQVKNSLKVNGELDVNTKNKIGC